MISFDRTQQLSWKRIFRSTVVGASSHPAERKFWLVSKEKCVC